MSTVTDHDAARRADGRATPTPAAAPRDRPTAAVAGPGARPHGGGRIYGGASADTGLASAVSQCRRRPHSRRHRRDRNSPRKSDRSAHRRTADSSSAPVTTTSTQNPSEAAHDPPDDTKDESTLTKVSCLSASSATRLGAPSRARHGRVSRCRTGRSIPPRTSRPSSIPLSEQTAGPVWRISCGPRRTVLELVLAAEAGAHRLQQARPHPTTPSSGRRTDDVQACPLRLTLHSELAWPGATKSGLQSTSWPKTSKSIAARSQNISNGRESSSAYGHPPTRWSTRWSSCIVGAIAREGEQATQRGRGNGPPGPSSAGIQPRPRRGWTY